MRCLLIAVFLLCGCASKAPRRALPPAPPVASTVEVRRAVNVNREKTQSAKVRVETVIREIEVVKEVVPEEFRQQLTEIQGELFKVTVELREAQREMSRFNRH